MTRAVDVALAASGGYCRHRYPTRRSAHDRLSFAGTLTIDAPMIAYLGGAGFLRPHSSIGADLSLVIMIAAFVMLTIGVVLVKSKRYQAHRWVQTAAVLLNAVPVIFWMIRSFRLYVLPGLPGNLSKSVDAVTTVHAVAGLIGVVLGVFVIIRANQLEARGESLSRYKNLMRIAYVVYLIATALGIWVYIALFG